ncbi:MAG: DNA-3-methyladenine glycosylase [Candidatus Taylorbacteria bacterium]|nr:DNA-3-methyladenine glycosylase [Candidatus Taylorbacteria bacterium]
MSVILKPAFFRREVLIIAEELVGCYLCTEVNGLHMRFRIIEVEAYDGFDDKASHASKGLTERTAVMFGPPRHWYVYFIYGAHWMLNIVTGPKGYPAAILLRSAGHLRGPGRLTKFLGVNKALNGRKAEPNEGFWIEKGTLMAGETIKKTPRIGVDYAGPKWSKRRYRFVLSTSRPR